MYNILHFENLKLVQILNIFTLALLPIFTVLYMKCLPSERSSRALSTFHVRWTISRNTAAFHWCSKRHDYLHAFPRTSLNISQKL